MVKNWVVEEIENGEVKSIKSFSQYEKAMQYKAMLLNGGPHEKEDE